VTSGFVVFSKPALTSCAFTLCGNQPSLQRLAEQEPTSLLSLWLSLLRCVGPGIKPSRKPQRWAGYKCAETHNMCPSSVLRLSLVAGSRHRQAGLLSRFTTYAFYAAPLPLREGTRSPNKPQPQGCHKVWEGSAVHCSALKISHPKLDHWCFS
jgi:hypothetical protein